MNFISEKPFPRNWEFQVMNNGMDETCFRRGIEIAYYREESLINQLPKRSEQ
jgi:hypothetical protein